MDGPSSCRRPWSAAADPGRSVRSRASLARPGPTRRWWPPPSAGTARRWTSCCAATTSGSGRCAAAWPATTPTRPTRPRRRCCSSSAASAPSTAGRSSRPGPTGWRPTPASTSSAGASAGQQSRCPTTTPSTDVADGRRRGGVRRGGGRADGDRRRPRRPARGVPGTDRAPRPGRARLRARSPPSWTSPPAPCARASPGAEPGSPSCSGPGTSAAPADRPSTRP